MKKVYLETFGCQMNVSDSERIGTQLERDGYEMTKSIDAADVVLFNTCSVREKAEQKLLTRIGQIHHSEHSEKIVGVTGCVAQLEGEKLFRDGRGIDFVVGTKATGRIAQAIEKSQKKKSWKLSNKHIDLGEREFDYDWSTAPNQRHSKYVAYLPIIEGCNKFCTYCIVPFSRGREKSFTATEIVGQITVLQSEGVREVHLIGQNVNSYRPISDDGLEGFYGSTPFGKLLRAVAATGIERIKFTTSFPRDFNPDIVDAIDEHQNLCNWVHLPVQSGSDKILKAMKRGHTTDNYKKRIDKIRSSKRDITITTDLIVGFPGETDEDFQQTLDLVNYCEFDSAYIFKYSARPGTPAAELTDNLSREVVSERFTTVDSLVEKHQTRNLTAIVGRRISVLAESKSKNDANFLTGHSTCNRVVKFESGEENLGKIVDIKIVESKRNSLLGII